MSNATELLRRALRWVTTTPDEQLELEIRKFLAAEPEAEPFADSIPKGVLKWNPEAEPVYVNAPSAVALSDDPETDFGMMEPIGQLHPNGRFELTDDELPIHLAFPVKLYTRPEPARKPMTHEEIIQGVTVDTSDDFHAGYWAGIRFAEKHHGFSSSIPSLNDTISEDSEEIKPIWLKPNEMIGWRGYFDVRGFDRMYGDVFDSEEECMARTPTATGYQQIVIELPEEELIDEELENKDE